MFNVRDYLSGSELDKKIRDILSCTSTIKSVVKIYKQQERLQINLPQLITTLWRGKKKTKQTPVITCTTQQHNVAVFLADKLARSSAL